MKKRTKKLLSILSRVCALLGGFEQCQAFGQFAVGHAAGDAEVGRRRQLFEEMAGDLLAVAGRAQRRLFLAATRLCMGAAGVATTSITRTPRC